MTKAYDRYKNQITDPKIKELEVSPLEFQDLINDPLTMVGIAKPQPPVKFSKKEHRTIKRWFRRNIEHQTEMIEYDYHAPEYLASMERWENESRQIKNGVYFMGMKVILKDPGTDMVIG